MSFNQFQSSNEITSTSAELTNPDRILTVRVVLKSGKEYYLKIRGNTLMSSIKNELYIREQCTLYQIPDFLFDIERTGEFANSSSTMNQLGIMDGDNLVPSKRCSVCYL